MDAQPDVHQNVASHDDERSLLEMTMNFPPCPECKEGHLIPFSSMSATFSIWVCSASACGYTIGQNSTEHTYYKGTAAATDKDKGFKKWKQYDF